MLAAPLVFVAWVALAQKAESPPDPTKPSLVTLDFKDRPIHEVASAITTRSGNPVTLQYQDFGPNSVPKVTLMAPAAVPFWEAIDRYCVAAKLQRTIQEPVGFGSRMPNLTLFGPGSEPGPASYTGPLRLANFTIHATYRKRFVPTSFVDPATADGYRVEFEVQPEPRVMAIRTGPLAKLEAIDDQGKSLLDPTLTDPEKVSAPVGGYGLGAYQSLVRIRLGTPSPGSKRLKTLRGLMPVELAISPMVPTATIPLATSVGQTTKAGDLAITIEEFNANPGTSTTLRLVAKVEGKRGSNAPGGKPLAWARTAAIQRCLEVVDAEGRVLSAASGGTSAGDELRLNYTFWPNRGPGPNGSTPKTLRVYAPEWVSWDAPFEFSDVPLP